MTLWLDAHLSPAVADNLIRMMGLVAVPVRDLGLRDADDLTTFMAARRASAFVVTKDDDFAQLVRRLGCPPQIVWLRCGNCSNQMLCQLLTDKLNEAIKLIVSGEPLVEIR